jgi:hypothetical protein
MKTECPHENRSNIPGRKTKSNPMVLPKQEELKNQIHPNPEENIEPQSP